MPAINSLLVACCGSEESFTGEQTLFATMTEDAMVTVEHVIRGDGEQFGGSFSMVFDGVPSDAIPYDVSGPAFADTLMSISNLGNVHVTRGSEDENSALTWSITFDDWLDAGTSAYGPDRNITVDASGLRGVKAKLSMKSTGNWSKREVREIVMSGSASRCNYTTTIGNTGVSRTLRGFTFSSADEASSIEVALAPLEAYTGTLKVSLNSTRSKATWLVTFVDFIGSPALLKCDDANVRRATEGTGNEVGGTFKLTYGDETTPSLYSNNATAVDVRTALESLSTVDEVQVVRMEKSVSDGGGLRFRVTFTGSKVDGNVDLLTTDTSGMDGTNPYATVKEVRPGGEATGTFTLLLDSVETSAIPVNASADELRAKLLEIPAIDNRGLTVTRNTTKRDGYSWTVTFLPNDGVHDDACGRYIQINEHHHYLNNSAAVSIIVTTMRSSSDPVSGTFKSFSKSRARRLHQSTRTISTTAMGR